MRSDHSPHDEGQSPLSQWLTITVLVIVVVSVLLIYQKAQKLPQAQFSQLPKIAQAVAAGEVTTLTVRGDLLIADRTEGPSLAAYKEPALSAFETLRFLGVPAKALEDLPIQVEQPGGQFAGIWTYLSILALVLLAYWLFRSGRGDQSTGGNNLSNFGRSRPRLVQAPDDENSHLQYPRVTFQDVAGADSTKIELLEIVEFLKEPYKFNRLGARIPKGVLMAGPPGTGKTLLAKAVAGEAGVPFFIISGSEFVEMYVGVGACRVRDLFNRAREKSPAIIFIDEIDAVGRRRGAHLGGGSEEREQTLNQILVEMDGFNAASKVIIIAATNRPDILDPALLRPGRFDRKVTVDRPDAEERQAILQVHTRGKPLASGISLADLAKLTPGFVGADLENLVNEAAILAARRNLNLIGRQEFQDAMERIIAGPERKGHLLSPQERHIIAFHEAGHAVVMHHLPHCDPVHKVSIISRGLTLGYTMPLPEGDRYLRSREAFEDELVGLLSGRAAEEIVFEQVTTGAANDLERATKLAQAMVTRYGFSQTLGLRTFGEEQGNPYLGSLGEIRDYSEEMAQAIDREINQMLDMAYRRARAIIDQNRSQLERLAQALLEHETIERREFETLMV